MAHFIVETDSIQSHPQQSFVLTVKHCAKTKAMPQVLYEAGIAMSPV